MNLKKTTFSSVNVGIIKNVARKLINDSDYNTVSFGTMEFNCVSAGFGFALKNESSFIAVRAKKGIRIYINHRGIKYTIVVCDEDKNVSTSETVRKAYEKYCISTIMSIIEIWQRAGTDGPLLIKNPEIYKY